MDTKTLVLLLAAATFTVLTGCVDIDEEQENQGAPPDFEPITDEVIEQEVQATLNSGAAAHQSGDVAGIEAALADAESIEFADSYYLEEARIDLVMGLESAERCHKADDEHECDWADMHFEHAQEALDNHAKMQE